MNRVHDFLVAGLLVAAVSTQAGTFTWTQTAGGTQDWSNVSNWSGGSNSPVSGDTVDFSTVNIAADTTLNLGADRTATTWKFGDTSGSQNWIVSSSNKMILAGTTPTINVLTNNVTLNNLVDGTAGLVKTGWGTLTLSATNNYTGDTTISGGTLAIGSAGKLGNGNYAGNISIANNSALYIGGTASQTLSGSITNNGALIFSSSGAYTVSGNISGSGSVSYPNSNPNVTGTLTLSGTNTYTGTTSFGNNQIGATVTLIVSSFDYITSGSYTNHGLGSSLGAPTTITNGTIMIGVNGNGNKNCSATLKYTGPGETTDRVLTFAFNQSDKGIDASGSGLLKFTSPFTLTSVNRVTAFPALALQGSGLGEVAAGITDLYTGLPVTKSGTGTWTLDGTNTYTGATTISANGGTLEIGGAGVMGGGTYTNTISIGSSATFRYNSTATQTLSGVISGAGALVKNNTGTLNLTATNTYTGATTISNGTLLVNGSLTNASLVTVMSGGTLGGTGTVGIVTNSGTLSPGGAVMGTLTTSNLVLKAGCASVFDLNGTNVSDSVAVNGNLTFSGVPAVTVNMNPVVVGSYPLFFVTGSYPTNTVPPLSFVSSKDGVTSKLAWGNIGITNTLSVIISANGTLLMIK